MGNYIVNSYSKMVDPLDPYINAKTKLTHYNLNKSKDYCLKFERILDSENQLYIGIGNKKDENDSNLSLQVVRIGDYTNKYHRLLQFTESKNKLKYEFENNVQLVLKRTETNDILLVLFDLNNDRFISKNIDPFIVKHSKTISCASKEFDKIFELFRELSDKIE